MNMDDHFNLMGKEPLGLISSLTPLKHRLKPTYTPENDRLYAKHYNENVYSEQKKPLAGAFVQNTGSANPAKSTNIKLDFGNANSIANANYLKIQQEAQQKISKLNYKYANNMAMIGPSQGQATNMTNVSPFSVSLQLQQQQGLGQGSTTKKQQQQQIQPASFLEQLDMNEANPGPYSRGHPIQQQNNAIQEDAAKTHQRKKSLQYNYSYFQQQQNQNPKQQLLCETVSKKELQQSPVAIQNMNLQPQQQDNSFQHPFKHLMFSPQFEDEEAFKKHLLITYRGLVYAKKCLKGPSEKFIQTKLVNLVNSSKYSKKKTLLLDLDETLIHSCNEFDNPEHKITVVTDSGETTLCFNRRPYCLELLQQLSKCFDIFIFTASTPTYANAIIKFLDPKSQYILGVLTRSNCMETKNGFYIKDLRILNNKDMKDIVIVDNLAHSFGFQIDNGIPIQEWHNDKNDVQLKFLKEYLLKLAKVDDVRVFNRQQLKLNELAELALEDIDI